MCLKELGKILTITFLLLATTIPFQTQEVQAAPSWHTLSGYNYFSSEWWTSPEIALNGTGYGSTDLDGELVISLLKPYNLTKISSRSNLNKDPTNVTVYYKTKNTSAQLFIPEVRGLACERSAPRDSRTIAHRKKVPAMREPKPLGGDIIVSYSNMSYVFKGIDRGLL